MLKIAFSPIYHHPLPAGHRFPMEKYSLLPEQLLYEGTATEAHFFAPTPIRESEIVTTHNAEYWQKLKTLSLTKKEERRTGFPLSEKLVEREVTIAGGTIENTEYALKYGCSMNIAGGTHHAYTNRGEGFCLLNDIALGANHLLRNGLCRNILVVDLDVHQGNGTAEIFENEHRVFTFSMHGKNNYPLHKETSNLDVELPDGITDKAYLKLLDQNLNQTLDSFQPDFVFFQAGVDVLHTDKLGRLGLTIAGCKQRDKMIFERCKSAGLPVAVSMGGGYSERLTDIIEAHANTYRLAQEIFY